MKDSVKHVSAHLCWVIALMLCLSCSSANERLIDGKWSLAGRMIGGAPSSFWFKGRGTVVAPWEKHQYAFRSFGTYEFISDRRIKIVMNKGYYKGKIYFFNILKLNENRLVLGDDYEDIKMKRASQS